MRGTESELRAVGGLQVSYEENRAVVEKSESAFERVIWVRGNHESWTVEKDDTAAPRGVARYEALVAMCRRLGVLTPEDPYPVWTGAGGPVRIAPLFLLYGHSFLAPGTSTPEESLARAHETGIVCTDGAEAVVYGYLHIPQRAAYDRARFEEASLGFPREWRQSGPRDDLARQIVSARHVPAAVTGRVGA